MLFQSLSKDTLSEAHLSVTGLFKSFRFENIADCLTKNLNLNISGGLNRKKNKEKHEILTFKLFLQKIQLKNLTSRKIS